MFLLLHADTLLLSHFPPWTQSSGLLFHMLKYQIPKSKLGRMKTIFPWVVFFSSVRVRKHSSQCKLTTQLRFSLLFLRQLCVCVINRGQRKTYFISYVQSVKAIVHVPFSGFPCTLQTFDKCFLGSSETADTNRVFCGQMGAVYLFGEALSAAQILAICQLGPGYQVGRREVQQCPREQRILKLRLSETPLLCTSGHVQVQGWERSAVCGASQDLTLRRQAVL